MTRVRGTGPVSRLKHSRQLHEGVKPMRSRGGGTFQVWMRGNELLCKLADEIEHLHFLLGRLEEDRLGMSNGG